MLTRVQMARLRAGLRQADLGALCGASKSVISRYEHRLTRVDPEIARKIARILRIPVSEVRGPDGRAPKDEPQDVLAYR